MRQKMRQRGSTLQPIFNRTTHAIHIRARDHCLFPHFLKDTVVLGNKFVFELNSFNAFNANLTALIMIHQ